MRKRSDQGQKRAPGVCHSSRARLSTEIEAWIAALPVRRLKGDEPLEMA
jgi:hypothetical protein